MGDPVKHYEMIEAVMSGAECQRKTPTGVIRVRFFCGELEQKWDTDTTWGPLSNFVYNDWEIAPPDFVSFVEAFAAMKSGKRVRFDGWLEGITMEFSGNRFHRKISGKEGAAWQPFPNELDEPRWVIL